MDKDDSSDSSSFIKFKKNGKKETFGSNYSIIPSSEVTIGAVEVWRGLPKAIRHDPSLASFRQEHERLHGEDLEDDSPSNEYEFSAYDNRTNNLPNTNPPIHITNEFGDTYAVKGETNGNGVEHEEQSLEDKKEIGIDWFNTIKMVLLLLVWILFTGILMSKVEKEVPEQLFAVMSNRTSMFTIPDTPPSYRIGVYLTGPFLSDRYANTTENRLTVTIQIKSRYQGGKPPSLSENTTSDLIVFRQNIDTKSIPLDVIDGPKIIRQNERRLIFDIGKVSKNLLPNGTFRIRLESNLNHSIPIKFQYDPTPIDTERGVIYAAIVLLGLYILIIWELVHRTFAAIIASTLSLGILAALNERPTMALLISWVDVETLLLLFGMMILVAILSETGIFDYLAVWAYKVTNGRVWPLIICLCGLTAVLSSFLDNVTTVLLMTPVTIRLCEVMGLNPVPILMSMIIYSNIGGALTPVGDPPNVIISSNPMVIKDGVNFFTFLGHMIIGISLVMVQTYIQLRYKFRNISDLRFKDPSDVQELKHEIDVWKRAAASLSSYSKDEDLVRVGLLKKVTRLGWKLKKAQKSGAVPVEHYRATLEELQAKYPIRDKVLLVKCAVTLIFVVSFFCLHSFPSIQRLSLGWTALLGAILLLILSDREDMDAILARVEWSTLLFFAALFILMEALAKLGIIQWIGEQTEMVIMSVSEESRLAVAILLILWVSALASAFVDNIPLTTMMIKIATSLAENETLNLPLQPLIWALALGACLGGNGTLIGASANVVCAGVAEQHGYRFTFTEYFKVGFPVMIGSIIVSSGYLMVAHVVFTWH